MLRTLIFAASALAASGLQLAVSQPAPANAGAIVAAPIESRVAAVCTSCHNAQVYSNLRGTRLEWRRHVYEMMLHGAQIKPAEVEPIVQYLASTYGPEGPRPASAPIRAAPAPGMQGDSAREALVSRACVSCHAMNLVTATRRTPADWDAVITRMQANGAQMTPDDRAAIVSYLNDHFGK